LDADYEALSNQASQLDETGNSAEIPPGLTLDVLEDKLKALKVRRRRRRCCRPSSSSLVVARIDGGVVASRWV
jgi:hypothetical protein